MSGYFIRTMDQTELGKVLGWAEQEGWRPGLVDAECFYPADSGGFFIGLLDGEPIGSISAVRYGDDYGFIGLYIVKPEWRNQGFGIQLWQTAMRYLQGRNIGLDGVIAQQGNYQKSGFSIAYRHVRYQGKTDRPIPCRADDVVVPIADVGFEQVLAYDSALFPASRPLFLEKWLIQKNAVALAVIQQNQLAGYGVIRPCHSGFRIGPLFADNQEIADALLNALLARIPKDSDFFMDIPEINQQAIAWVANRNMQPVFETARMYTRDMPKIDLGKVFAVTTLELG